MLASKIDISPDAKTFTFRLRDGVKFQNGKVMTSADVVASFERYRRVSPNAKVFTDVESYSAPDPSTFVVKLNKPNAVFVDILKSPVYPFEILPVEEKDKAPREIDIIGTGPYKLGEWVKDSHLVLKRFDGYTPNEKYKGLDGFARQSDGLSRYDPLQFRARSQCARRRAAGRRGRCGRRHSTGPREAVRRQSRHRGADDHSILHAGLCREHAAGSDQEIRLCGRRSRPSSMRTTSPPPWGSSTSSITRSSIRSARIIRATR